MSRMLRNILACFQWFQIVPGASTRHTRDMDDHRIIRNLVNALRRDHRVIERLAKELALMQLRHGTELNVHVPAEHAGMVKTELIRTTGRELRTEALYTRIGKFVAAARAHDPRRGAWKTIRHKAAKRYNVDERTVASAVRFYEAKCNSLHH